MQCIKIWFWEWALNKWTTCLLGQNANWFDWNAIPSRITEIGRHFEVPTAEGGNSEEIFKGKWNAALFIVFFKFEFIYFIRFLNKSKLSNIESNWINFVCEYVKHIFMLRCFLPDKKSFIYLILDLIVDAMVKRSPWSMFGVPKLQWYSLACIQRMIAISCPRASANLHIHCVHSL